MMVHVIEKKKKANQLQPPPPGIVKPYCKLESCLPHNLWNSTYHLILTQEEKSEVFSTPVIRLASLPVRYELKTKGTSY